MGAKGGGGGGKTMGKRPCRCANFNRAAICFFHFVRRFWNHVLICTSVKFRVLLSSSLLDTDKYLSACNQNQNSKISALPRGEIETIRRNGQKS